MNVTLKDWLKILPQKNIKLYEPICKHTTFNIGGIADWFITPSSVNQLVVVITFCKQKKLNYFIIGAGSNCLFSDKGFNGVLISLEKFNRCKFDGEFVTVGAGLKLSTLLSLCLTKCLSGLEFCVGIPATCGGAVTMNAGAYGYEISDFINEIWILKNGKIEKLTNSECEFGYRKSRFRVNDEIILKVRFKLLSSKRRLILENMQKFLARRCQTQPHEPSAGSVFKRTETFPAGFLIEQAGLKGLCLGNAKISNIHANFIVNLGGATCKEVLSLIEIARNEVYLQFGIILEPEIILIGEKYEDFRRLSHS